MSTSGFDLWDGNILDTEIANGMKWSIPFGSYKLFESVVERYNITLPREQYIVNLEWEITNLYLCNTTIQSNDHPEIKNHERRTEGCLAEELTTTVISMFKLEIGETGLKIENSNNYTIVFNVYGDEPVKLKGEIEFKSGNGEIYIFSKGGFEIDGFIVKSIQINLIASLLENYISNGEEVTNEGLKNKIYSQFLNSTAILNQGINAEYSNITFWSNESECYGKIEGGNLKFCFTSNQASQVYLPVDHFICQLDVESLAMNAQEANAILNTKFSINAKKVNINTLGGVNNYGKYNLSSSYYLVANRFNNYGEIRANNATIECSKDQEINIEGYIQTLWDLTASAQKIKINKGKLECGGLLYLRASGEQENGVFFAPYVSVEAGKIIIESFNGSRIGKLELDSARVIVTNNAKIKSTEIKIEGGYLINNYEVENYNNKIWVKFWPRETSARNFLLEIFKKTYRIYKVTPIYSASPSFIYIGKDLILDSELVYIDKSHIQARKAIYIDNLVQPTVVITTSIIKPGFITIYCKGDHSYENIVKKFKVPDGDVRHFSNILEEPEGATCVPASFYGAEGVFGKFQKIETGCLTSSQFDSVDPTQHIKAIMGSAPNDQNALAHGVNQISESDNKQIYFPDSNRPIKDEEQEINPLKRIDKYHLKEMLHLEESPLMLASEVGSSTGYKEYLYKEKYAPLISCGIDIAYILNNLGIKPGSIGKIICEANCQMEMVNCALEASTGFSNFYQLLDSIKEYLIANNIYEESSKKISCYEIKYLLDSAIEQRNILGLEVGIPLSGILFDKIKKPFIWPVYEEINGVKVLIPTIYLTKEIIMNSLGRNGAFFGGKELDIIVSDYTYIGGALVGKSGSFKVPKLVVSGYIIKNGEKSLAIEVDNLAITSLTETKQLFHNFIFTERLTHAGISSSEGELILLVKEDFLSKGSKLDGTVIAEVGRDVIVIPALQITAYQSFYNNWYTKVAIIKNILPELNGDIKLSSEGNQIINGAVATPGSHIKFISKYGKVTIQAAQDASYREDYYEEKDEEIFGLKSRIRSTHKVDYIRVPVGNIFGSISTPIDSFTSISSDHLALLGIQLYTKELHIESGKGNSEPKDIIVSAAEAKSFSLSQTKEKKKGIGVSSRGISLYNSKEETSYHAKTTQIPSKIVIFNTEDNPAYFISNGVYTQLASEVNSHTGEIVITAPKGANIVDLQNTDILYAKVEEAKGGISFSFNKKELAIKAGAKIQSLSLEKGSEVPAISKLSAKKLSIITKKGYLRTKGAILEYKEALFIGLGHIDQNAVAKYFEDTKSKSGELYVKLGFRSSLADAIDSTKAAVQSNVGSAISGINAISKVYGAFVDWLRLIAIPIQGGLYIYGKIEDDKFKIIKMEPIATELRSSGETRHEVDKLHLQGTKVTGISWYVSAKEVLFTSAYSSYEEKSSNRNAEVVIPIGSTIIPTLSVTPIKMASGKVEQYHALQIKMLDEAIFDIAGPINIEGGYIEAGKLVINAKSLLFKSVQNLIEKKGSSVSLSLDDLTSIETVFTGLSGHIERKDTKWISEITTILGKEKVEIILAKTLNIAGSVIANAERNVDGTYTDKGKLYIKAAEIIAESIHGYDDGVLLGGSLFKGEANGIIRSSYGVKLGYTNKEQVVKATIGEGEIEGEIKGNLNRDLNNAEYEDGSEIETLDIKYTHINYDKLNDLLDKTTFVERVVGGSGLDKLTSYLEEQFKPVEADDVTEAEAEELRKKSSNQLEELGKSNQENNIKGSASKNGNYKITEKEGHPDDVTRNRIYNEYVSFLVKKGIEEKEATTKVSQVINENEYHATRSVRVAALPLALPFILEGVELLSGAILAKIIGDKLKEDYPKLKEQLTEILLHLQNKERALEKSKEDGKSKVKVKVQDSVTPAMPDPDWEPDDDYLKKYEKFKKQDGSGRYECEKQESPVWKELKNYKDQFKTNGLRGSDKKYFRWDYRHKDIEVYDNKARYLGSQDPVSGKIYRPGSLLENPKLKNIIK